MYELLRGVRVLDVSILAPDMLGMHLADLGAEVIKIESPPDGDHIRIAPGRVRAGAPSFSHLRWNRSKRSVALNLKSAQGVEIFLALAKQADVVIEGLRAGAMERLGVGYAAVRHVNPKIVFCAISGTGQSGPYARLGMHGVGLDAFAGLVPVAFREDGLPYIGPHVPLGSRVGPLYGAFATAAALVQAQRTGKGAYIDIAETDAAAFAHADGMLGYLNTGKELPPDVLKNSVRYQCYRTADGRFVLLFAYEFKFWKKFCEALERPDLIHRGGDTADAKANDLGMADGDEPLRAELTQIMQQKTQAEWVRFFEANDIPGGPLNSMTQMLDDPHFKAREHVLDYEHPGLGTIQMPTTPIKIDGSGFEMHPAPPVGEHTDEVLRSLLKYDATRLDALREAKVIT